MEYTKQELRELQAIEKQMLEVFVDICEKLNLRYYLIAGTLLGAVRHGGFIPWDDDIDVGMPRQDYEIFLEKGQALLPKHLFLQTIWTDREYLNCFAKIRNSNTAFIETTVANHHINHGVFIDVFPLDHFPEKKNEQRKVQGKKRLYKLSIAGRYNVKRTLKQRIVLLAAKALCPSYRKALEKRETLFMTIPESALSVNYGGAWGKKEIMPWSWYGEGVDVSFEGLTVKAPVAYHEMLTQLYGDYMTPPPVHKQVTHHYTDVIDLEKSYTQYLGK